MAIVLDGRSTLGFARSKMLGVNFYISINDMVKSCNLISGEYPPNFVIVYDQPGNQKNFSLEAPAATDTVGEGYDADGAYYGAHSTGDRVAPNLPGDWSGIVEIVTNLDTYRIPFRVRIVDVLRVPVTSSTRRYHVTSDVGARDIRFDLIGKDGSSITDLPFTTTYYGSSSGYQGEMSRKSNGQILQFGDSLDQSEVMSYQGKLGAVQNDMHLWRIQLKDYQPQTLQDVGFFVLHDAQGTPPVGGGDPPPVTPPPSPVEGRRRTHAQTWLL